MTSNDPRRRLQISFWCNPRLVLGFQLIFGVRRPSFWASNQFLVQSEAHFGLQTSFWCAATLILGFKPVFGAIRGSFWASNQFLAQSEARFGLPIGFWSNPRVILGLPRVIIHPWALLIIQIVRDSFESLPVASINQPCHSDQSRIQGRFNHRMAVRRGAA